MKKNHFSLRRKAYALMSLAAGVLLFASCAQDGFDEESFDSGVYNTQLEAPSTDDIQITASADGTQQTISWPVVYGAGGYHAILTNTTAGEVLIDSVYDGTSFAVARVEDNNYELSLEVLGNEERNNTGCDPVIKTFNTFAAAFASIPSGTDLYEYFQNNPLPDLQESDLIYDLEPGGQYTMSGKVDFGAQNSMIRVIGDNNALITCSDGACFIFGNGFKMQNINIDNTDNTANGLFTMSDTPSESLSTEALGYKAAGANQNGYVMTKPVSLKNVNVKNLKKSLIYGNKTNWSLTNLIIENCIIQLDNDGSNGVINMYGASNGLIKSIQISNNTFYNLKENSSAYFLRYSNSSNAQPQKIFGTDQKATITFTHNTVANVFTGKDFANNLANTNLITTTMTDNIFYDVFRVYQFIQTNTIKTTTNNYIWWVKTSPQTNDTSRTDNNGNPLCTEADPGFPTMETLQALDFNAVNCGVNFTPTGTPLSGMAGDPRWLPAAE